MSLQNTMAILNRFRQRGVSSVITPAGVKFFGVRNISKGELETLLQIPQQELKAAMKWQK